MSLIITQLQQKILNKNLVYHLFKSNYKTSCEVFDIAHHVCATHLKCFSENEK